MTQSRERRPAEEIFRILLDTLVKLGEGQYTTGEIAEKAGLSWRTVKQYLELMKELQDRQITISQMAKTKRITVWEILQNKEIREDK